MNLLNTAGTFAIWWRVIIPFTIIGIISTLVGLSILYTPRRVGYKITRGIIKDIISITKSEPRTKKNSSRIYYNYYYTMAIQFMNKKTKELVISNLNVTTERPNSYRIGGGINIEYDKNNCSATDASSSENLLYTPTNGCNISLGNSMTKNTKGGIFLVIGIISSVIALGAIRNRNSKNLQGALLIGGTLGAGGGVMRSLTSGVLDSLIE